MGNPKTSGIRFLKKSLETTKRNPNAKFMSIPLKQAEQIIAEAKDFKPKDGEFRPDQLCIKTAAMSLCMKPEELCRRLNNPCSSAILDALSEQRHLVMSMQACGDKWIPTHPNENAKTEWFKAKIVAE